MLQRPCEECGFDSSAMLRDQLAPSIRELLPRWQIALRRDDVAARTRSDRWSVLEYGCHVRDVFQIFDSRLSLMLSSDDARFSNWDQDKTAIEQHYERSMPTVVADELVAAGDRIADRFEEVSGAQWDRSGVRSNGSRFSVETLGRYMLHDVVHHLVDIAAM